MSCFSLDVQETTITIPNTVKRDDGVILYEISVSVANISWKIFHRFSDFVELNERLVTDRAVSKDLLPKKKVIGKNSPSFIEKRKKGLEIYLQDVLVHLQLTMPREFVEFLHFDEYDVIFLLQSMASQFFLYGDTLISSSKMHTFAILECMAISKRMKLPCHPLENTENRFDFSHVLDFCIQLQYIAIVPSKYSKVDVRHCEDLEQFGHIMPDRTVPLGTSNIVPADLKFDLNAFRNLKKLALLGVSIENISIDSIRPSLSGLFVHQTGAAHFSDILLCDDIHKSTMTDPCKVFQQLETLNLSENEILAIDETVNLAPNVQSLILNRNRIETLSNLRGLTHLSHLSLSQNKITDVIDWHMELGNLVTLNLSQNFIRTLIGFRKLFSLHYLDLSCNQIVDIGEVDHLASLPCLEHLKLTGNQVAATVDYRAKVLSRFQDRVRELHLDNEKASQKEIDTALVLAAVRLSKENSASPSKVVPTNLGFGT